MTAIVGAGNVQAALDVGGHLETTLGHFRLDGHLIQIVSATTALVICHDSIHPLVSNSEMVVPKIIE